MRKMTDQECIDVIQAYMRGETLEVLIPGGTWKVLNLTPIWSFNENMYRVKSKPKYRPYTRQEAEQLLGQTFISSMKYKMILIGVDTNNLIFGPIKIQFQQALDTGFTYNGYPAGVLENA